MRPLRSLVRVVLFALVVSSLLSSQGRAASRDEIDQDATAALERLYRIDPEAEELGRKARAVLVFPDIVKAGLIIGGAYGEGALRQDGKTVGYYSTFAASYGLQAGAQTFGYVMFFMNDGALSYLEESDGWEIGSGPSVVVLDDGFGKKLSSTTLTEDVYTIIFGQQGLMAGIGLEGSKISKMKNP